MALKATIFKASLLISDIDRNYYGEHALTLARHPSETDERMMMRVLAFALNAHEHLAFGKGLSDADEPDVWQRDLTGTIVHWIDVGQPDERRLIRASARAQRVSVYAYGNRVESWWKASAERLQRAKNLAVWRVPGECSGSVARFAERVMQLQCMVQEGQVWFGSAAETVQIEVGALQPAG
ncbi:MAG: YaeQ family protein [Burkholderiales bacterium]